jgi:hypothetical protein
VGAAWDAWHDAACALGGRAGGGDAHQAAPPRSARPPSPPGRRRLPKPAGRSTHKPTRTHDLEAGRRRRHGGVCGRQRRTRRSRHATPTLATPGPAPRPKESPPRAPPSLAALSEASHAGRGGEGGGDAARGAASSPPPPLAPCAPQLAVDGGWGASGGRTGRPRPSWGRRQRGQRGSAPRRPPAVGTCGPPGAGCRPLDGRRSSGHLWERCLRLGGRPSGRRRATRPPAAPSTFPLFHSQARNRGKSSWVYNKKFPSLISPK